MLELVPEVVGDPAAAISWAGELGILAPKPGQGRTDELWRLLAEVAATDVGVARVLEPHLDALAILDQAGISPTDLGAPETSTWGVYAAEAPGFEVIARLTVGGWVLDGAKAWCSLARDLSHALVTARREDGARALFAVDLHSPGITASSGPWAARGLSWIVSAPVRFESVRALPVGGPEWYLERPGFAWGGMGVAACWYGGAIGVARALRSREWGGRGDQFEAAHIGAVDAALHGARTSLAWAANAVDDPQSALQDASLLAMRTRAVVVDSAERVLTHTARALGPAPLALDEDHARRVADLQLYLRQHHADRDDAALGRALDTYPDASW